MNQGPCLQEGEINQDTNNSKSITLTLLVSKSCSHDPEIKSLGETVVELCHRSPELTAVSCLPLYHFLGVDFVGGDAEGIK